MDARSAFARIQHGEVDGGSDGPAARAANDAFDDFSWQARLPGKPAFNVVFVDQLQGPNEKNRLVKSLGVVYRFGVTLGG